MKFVTILSLGLCSLISKLPASPFQGLLAGIEEIPFLGFLNYFIPFDFAVTALSAWAPCVIAWRLYKLVRRVFLKVADAVSGLGS